MVLTASSECFAKMITDDLKEKTSHEIELKEITAAGLRPLIESCYSGRIRLTNVNVRDVLAAAHLYCFTKIVEKCGEFLLKHFALALRAEMLGAPERGAK